MFAFLELSPFAAVVLPWVCLDRIVKLLSMCSPSSETVSAVGSETLSLRKSSRFIHSARVFNKNAALESQVG